MLNSRPHITHKLPVALSLPQQADCSENRCKPSSSDGCLVTVQPRTFFDAGMEARANADGWSLGRTFVIAYEDGSSVSNTHYPLSLSLLNGAMSAGYRCKPISWTCDVDNLAYSIKRGVITAVYADYLNGGFAMMEQLDAHVSSVSILDVISGNVTLTRPFARLSNADKAAREVAYALVCAVENVAVSLDPFLGKSVNEGDALTFTLSTSANGVTHNGSKLSGCLHTEKNNACTINQIVRLR